MPSLSEQPDREGGRAQAPASFVTHARTVAALTLVSRISGLARDAICSRVFGTSAVWSAFVTAFMIPNLFRRLFGEGALSAAFIPRYTTLLEEGQESQDEAAAASDRFASLTVLLLSSTLGIVTLIAELVLLAVLMWGGRSSDDGSLSSLIVLAMLMLPFMPLVCVTAILGGILQVRGRFAPHAAAPVLLNLAMSAASIIGAVAFDSLVPAASLVAISVTVAGIVQAAWCFWLLKGVVRWQRASGDAWGQVKKMLLAMGPVIVGMGALQLSSLVDAAVAGYPLAVGPTLSWGARTIAYPLDQSSAAVLYFAQRLYQFPLGVFGIAIATAVFPALARAGAKIGRGAGEAESLRESDAGQLYAKTLREGIRLSLFIAWPATLGLVAVRSPLTAVLYRGGDFSQQDVARVAAVLAGYAMAVWAYALTHVLTRGFYALGDMKTPMKAGLVSVVANIALNMVLIWPMKEAGLAWSTAICASGQALALAWLAKRRLAGLAGSGGGLLDGASARSVARIFVCGALMLAVLLGVDSLLLGPVLERWMGDPAGWLSHACQLFTLMMVGAGVYAGAAKLLGLPELGWVMHTLGIGRSGSDQPPDKP